MKDTAALLVKCCQIGQKAVVWATSILVKRKVFGSAECTCLGYYLKSMIVADSRRQKFLFSKANLEFGKYFHK